jgi:hypothetical protein
MVNHIKVKCINDKKSYGFLKEGEEYWVLLDVMQAINHNNPFSKEQVSGYILKLPDEKNSTYPYVWDRDRFIIIYKD